MTSGFQLYEDDQMWVEEQAFWVDLSMDIMIRLGSAHPL